MRAYLNLGAISVYQGYQLDCFRPYQLHAQLQLMRSLESCQLCVMDNILSIQFGQQLKIWQSWVLSTLLQLVTAAASSCFMPVFRQVGARWGYTDIIVQVYIITIDGSIRLVPHGWKYMNGWWCRLSAQLVNWLITTNICSG